VREIDKRALGRRIREVRREAGLRQRELAAFLGTTQSAIHKYERGVIPEPRRLLEIARVGETTVEWLLTGRHGETAGSQRRRPSDRTLRMAEEIERLAGNDRERVELAVRILRVAEGAAGEDPEASLPELRRAVEAARRVQRAIVRLLLDDAAAKLTP
jgi:transcriptional regulator with XRE-family HTH domain